MFGKSPRGATARPDPSLKAPRSLAIPNWLWLIFVVLFGLSLAALLYLWQPWQPAKRPDVITTEQAEPEDEAPKTDAKGDYEFYDLLPRQQVTPVPQQEVPVRAPATVQAQPLPAQAEPPILVSNETIGDSGQTEPALERQPVYILQVNSYDNPDEADRQRAEVLLTGLSADIRQTRSGGVTWYRVVSGPYTSRSDAQAAQTTLQNSGIDALVVELP